jgi:outer membrane protein assembly factor BamD
VIERTKTDFVSGLSRFAVQTLAVIVFSFVLTGCSGLNIFGTPKIVEEEIIAPEVLYESALADMDRQYFATALETLEKLERQHPYSEYAERAKLMTVYANFRTGSYPEAVLASDRYLALYPSSSEIPYILYLKGTSNFAQIKDITRDQQLAQESIDTYRLLIANFPDSKYVDESRENMRVSFDQLAGKEMSVGRYYLGNGQFTAAINRFRAVVENYQTSTHIEEALHRLTEGYLKLGLLGEAQSAAAVLGLNYPSSSWYELSYELLQRQGLVPEAIDGTAIDGTLQLKRN